MPLVGVEPVASLEDIIKKRADLRNKSRSRAYD